MKYFALLLLSLLLISSTLGSSSVKSPETVSKIVRDAVSQARNVHSPSERAIAEGSRFLLAFLVQTNSSALFVAGDNSTWDGIGELIGELPYTRASVISDEFIGLDQESGNCVLVVSLLTDDGSDFLPAGVDIEGAAITSIRMDIGQFTTSISGPPLPWVGEPFSPLQGAFLGFANGSVNSPLFSVALSQIDFGNGSYFATAAVATDIQGMGVDLLTTVVQFTVNDPSECSTRSIASTHSNNTVVSTTTTKVIDNSNSAQSGNTQDASSFTSQTLSTTRITSPSEEPTTSAEETSNVETSETAVAIDTNSGRGDDEGSGVAYWIPSMSLIITTVLFL